ncbi:hypothetical protein [Micromonospora sp. WMMD987]|uniref:hypothetical protein n=1 Tax=Micromonospora TaxID=1873 RepID=UPI00249AD569|nr:hypothetical protein [Micromonospora sp. WMMD987]WFE95234.1 hypothetical protein O7612_28710 [Micromonospora sp. WMMD987]
MTRPVTDAPEAATGLPGDSSVPGPARPGFGRERTLDLLRAGGLRFRAGGRWRLAPS